MAWVLTEDAFAKLITGLDADRERAGEKYEDLRRTLLRFFEWRGASFPEERVDESLNRVARKLAEGVEVADIGAYAYQVARLVLLEAYKSRDARQTSLEAMREETGFEPVAAALDYEKAGESRRDLGCLNDCLRKLPPENRELITEYYQDEKRGRINRRQALAERLGLRRDALANRAQRLRDKLADCVRRCVVKTHAI